MEVWMEKLQTVGKLLDTIEVWNPPLTSPDIIRSSSSPASSVWWILSPGYGTSEAGLTKQCRLQLSKRFALSFYYTNTQMDLDFSFLDETWRDTQNTFFKSK